MNGQASLKLTHTQYASKVLQNPWVMRIILSIAFMVILFAAISKIDLSQSLPIKKVRIMGALVHVDESMLRNAINGKIQGGYFNLNVAHLKTVVEKLAWVETANVRRVWPDTVSIAVIEEKPLAVWNRDALINTKGNVFTPIEKTITGLPRFVAPEGVSKLAMEWFNIFQSRLQQKELAISKMTIDARRAITVELNNGITLVLGREEQLSRMLRFLNVYTRQLKNNIAYITKVDLRYSNGLAVQWKPSKSDNYSKVKINTPSAKRARGHMNHV